MTETEQKRRFLWDNLKGILIIAVVAGHVMEPYLKHDLVKLCYGIIYSFHMPLFSYCSGYLARFDPVKIKRKLLYPYLIFQILYLLFARIVLDEKIRMQLSRPYWILWYLLALIVWKMLLPFIETGSGGKRIAWIAVALCAGILAGWDNGIGYGASLSRIIVFFPFFLMGYYQKESISWDMFEKIRTDRAVRGFVLLLTAAVLGYLIVRVPDYRVSWLYGSLSYEKGNYTAMFRVLYDLSAMVLIAFFLCFVPDRDWKLGKLGRKCFPIYLLHGFVLMLLERFR